MIRQQPFSKDRNQSETTPQCEKQMKNDNAAIIERIRGAVASPASAESNNDPQNPNSRGLFDLSKNICPRCGTGHLSTPCAGGLRCTCACRNCNARMRCETERAPA